MAEPTQYLNVDLELGSNSSLDALCSELTPTLFEQYRGRVDDEHRERAHYESASCNSTPTDAIRAIVKVLDGLSPAARQCWRAAQMRDFNIGVQAGFQRKVFELPIDRDAMRDIIRLRGRLVLTVYSPISEETRPRSA